MQNCPNCDQSLDPNIGVEGESQTPLAGEFKVCTNCIELLKFDAALKFKIVVEPEIDALALEKPAEYRKIATAQSRIAVGNCQFYPPS